MSVASLRLPASRLGARLVWIARLLMLVVLLLPLLRWWSTDNALLLPAVLAQIVHAETLSTAQRLAGTVVDLLVAGIAVTTLAALAALGGCFRDGTALSAGTAGLQARLGRRLLWLAAAQVAYAPLITLAVTLFNPPGQRMLAIQITGGEAILLVGALVVFLFARMTEEAARLAEENAQIV